MPWEKSFDIDGATDLAMKVFWSKGYEATSIADLVEAMSINKGSLYNAFGSKKQLFIRTLLKYDAENRQQILARLSELNDPVEAIGQLFDMIIGEAMTQKPSHGCLLVNTALELPHHDQDVRDIVMTSMSEFEAFFRTTIIRGQTDGVIPRSIDASGTAKILLTLVVGLRVMSRGVFDANTMYISRDHALRLVGVEDTHAKRVS
ncbi:MAG: TetR/AcrR family transcriptional regulator [Pseudomonadota bacterium]